MGLGRGVEPQRGWAKAFGVALPAERLLAHRQDGGERGGGGAVVDGAGEAGRRGPARRAASAPSPLRSRSPPARSARACIAPRSRWRAARPASRRGRRWPGNRRRSADAASGSWRRARSARNRRRSPPSARAPRGARRAVRRRSRRASSAPGPAGRAAGVIAMRPVGGALRPVAEIVVVHRDEARPGPARQARRNAAHRIMG
jgi:hypothetical protein